MCFGNLRQNEVNCEAAFNEPFDAKHIFFFGAFSIGLIQKRAEVNFRKEKKYTTPK